MNDIYKYLSGLSIDAIPNNDQIYVDMNKYNLCESKR